MMDALLSDAAHGTGNRDQRCDHHGYTRSLHDGLGSIVAITNEAGAVVNP
jgi:hypothetical protein